MVSFLLLLYHTNGPLITVRLQDPKIGLIPRCMSHMFDRLNSQASDFSVRVSMLELYNEELFDLLSAADSTTKLRLFEDSTRKVTRGIVSTQERGGA